METETATSRTLDIAGKSLSTTRNRKVIYFLFVIQGMASLLPLFLTYMVVDFFIEKMKAFKPEYSLFIADGLFFSGTLLYLLIFNVKYSVRSQMRLSYIIWIINLIFIPIWAFNLPPVYAFTLIFLHIGMNSFSLGIVESAILELSGSVAPEFATAVFGGQGVSGFFNCIVRITIELSISSSSSSNHSLAIILYFVVVIILMVIFYCLYEVLMRKIPQDTPANSPETSLTNQSTDKRMLPAGRKQSDDVYIPVEPQSPPSSKIRRSQTPRYQKKAFFGVIPDEKAKVQNIFEEQVSIREAEEPSINKEMITEEKVQVQELCTSLDFGDLAAKHFDLCKTPDQHVKKEVKTIKSTTDSFMSSNILTSIPNTSPRSKRRKTLRKRHSLSPDQRRGSSPIKISKFLRRAETVTTDPLSPLSSDRERTIIPTLVPPTIQDLENLTFKDKRKLIWLIIKKTKGILIGIFILMASHYLIFPGYMIKMNVEGVEDCKWNTIIIVSVFSTFDTICRLSASKCSCIKPQAFWAPLIVRCAFTLVIVIVPIVQKGDELLSSVYTVVILVAGATIVLAISLSISFVFIYQTIEKQLHPLVTKIACLAQAIGLLLGSILALTLISSIENSGSVCS